MTTNEARQRAAASRFGMAFPEYQARIQAGLKRCHQCRNWRTRALFNVARSRYDGLQSRCKFCDSKAVMASRKRGRAT